MKSKTQNPNHTTLEGENILDEYVLNHSDAEPEYLYRLWRATNVHMLHGRMASGHLQGRLLKMLVKMVNPQNIIEVGTFSGYSALCMAEGLSEHGHLYTFEINDEQEPFTRKWIEDSPWADKITFIIGDAATEAKKIGKSLMNKGAFILADNTLWDGHVTDADYDKDQQTVGIRRFNDYVAADKRVEKVLLPLRDGLTMIRIRS